MKTLAGVFVVVSVVNSCQPPTVYPMETREACIKETKQAMSRVCYLIEGDSVKVVVE